MSFPDFHSQVQQLEDELRNASNHIKKLEREQRRHVVNFKTKYRARLERASSDLLLFMEYIREVDSLLLEEYSLEYEDNELEEYLDISESTMVSLNQTLIQSFRELGNHLTEGRKNLSQEHERAAEEDTVRINILNNKIADIQADIKKQLGERESNIKASVQEKEDAVNNTTRLERELDRMEALIPELDQSHTATVEATNNSAMMADVGMAISVVFPVLGFGMWAVGSGIKVIGEIQSSNIQDTIESTRNSISITHTKIAILNMKIADQMSKSLRLATDLELFEGFKKKVDTLIKESKILSSLSHQNIEEIITAKESIFAGESKMIELETDMEGLGYAVTREKLPQTLKIVIEKLRDGRFQLEGGLDSFEISDMLLMAEAIELDTEEVLEILNSS
ncbi:hypothetical protein TWF788_003902 [Orbilia oligospora]|uniref:Uncharacterized protein n=1 Tax=Orbilia oligospora TaxID=2813651 RepID=A0A7C8U3E4_ORBOL|nr:hypothetical protein TWF788_003902 [Orbilia oligospora]